MKGPGTNGAGGNSAGALDMTGVVPVDRSVVVSAVWLLEAQGDTAGLEALAYVLVDTDLGDFVINAWAGARRAGL